jgi:subtilisin family serine protease
MIPEQPCRSQLEHLSFEVASGSSSMRDASHPGRARLRPDAMTEMQKNKNLQRSSDSAGTECAPEHFPTKWPPVRRGKCDKTKGLERRHAAGRMLLVAVALWLCLISDAATAVPRPANPAAAIAANGDLHDAAFRGKGRAREARPLGHARPAPDFGPRSQLGSGKVGERHHDRRPRKRDSAHDKSPDKPRGTDHSGKPDRRKDDHKDARKPPRAHEHDRKKPRRFACFGGRVDNGACICRGGARAQRLGATMHYVCAPLRTVRGTPLLPLAAGAAAGTAAAGPAAAPPPERGGQSAARATETRPGEVLFWLDNALPENTESRIARRLGLEILSRTRSRLIGRRFVHARIRDDRPVSDVVALLRGEREISGPQPNFVYRQQQGEGLAGGTGLHQYALERIAWRDASRSASGRGAVVAIIDTGLDRTHPDLAGADIREFDTSESHAADDKAHATSLAGIIAGRNTTVGIAPDARILSLRAFTSTPGGVVGSTASILKALETAVAKGARILNLSFAGPRDPSLEKAIEAAARRNLILVAAAGNAGHGAPPAFPAAYPEVIAVTATDAGDRLYEVANTGPYVAIAAPGVDILVPVPGGTHDLKSGTSYAAAHVSAIVALMLELDPRLSSEAARRRLAAGAVDLGAPGKDEEFGAGRVNAALSLSANTSATSARRD